MRRKPLLWLGFVALALIGWLLFETARDWLYAIRSSWDSADSKVENGWAYDKAMLAVAPDAVLVVPDDARIERGNVDGRIEVYMEKELHFWGHPVEAVSIRNTRKRMGCASRKEDGKVIVATYGEWDSMIEGGTSMKLLIRAPDSLKIETRKGLSGPPRGKPRGAPKKLREEIELGKDGWQAIPDQPDRWKTASE